MTQTVAIIALLALFTTPVQQPAPPKQNDKPIQDNSFLVEEAYNQEKGVVQHINTFSLGRTGNWLYTFTQEWPVFTQKHQFSFTVPVQRVEESGVERTGWGDVALNYRYQLIGNGDTRVAVSPRFSLLLPFGNEERGLGAGATGYQINLPVSIVISDRFVAHSNVGATLTPSAKNEIGEKADLHNYNLGQSFIWQPTSRFNVMFETVWLSDESVIGDRLTDRSSSALVNPGIRWAHNFKSGLQIVPGISFPIGVGPSRGDRAIFFYLSFEHPIKRE
jgi:hypothetical protein